MMNPYWSRVAWWFVPVGPWSLPLILWSLLAYGVAGVLELARPPSWRDAGSQVVAMWALELARPIVTDVELVFRKNRCFFPPRTVEYTVAASWCIGQGGFRAAAWRPAGCGAALLPA